jgi:crossover junction endodeoxyribonuclease RusA
MTATAAIRVDGHRRWILDLPANPLLSLNQRLHWGDKSRRTKQWRDDTTILARQARIPHLDRIAVRLDHWPRDRRRRDRDNLVPVLKACIDGLVTAGVVDDDNPDRVRAELPVIHEPRASRDVLWLLYVDEVLA